MNHLLFPARGMPRPILGQVLSAPSLRTEFMAHENVPDRTQYRESWDDLMSHLDVQCAQRKDDHKRRIETEIAVLKTRDRHKRMENSEAMFERPDWTYCDPADYFEKPRPGTLQEPSNQYHKNDLLQGMYTCSEYKPPHWEYNVHGGWSPFDRNLRGRSLDMFGTKVPRQMDPKEKMYAERLEKKLAKAKAKEKQDVLERTMGIYKKKKIEANADPFSCLKRELPAWQDSGFIHMRSSPSQRETNLGTTSTKPVCQNTLLNRTVPSVMSVTSSVETLSALPRGRHRKQVCSKAAKSGRYGQRCYFAPRAATS